jgi:hypothetical protein
MRFVATCLAIATCAGCATQPVPNSGATATAVVHNTALTSPRPGTTPVTVKRDSGFLGAACATRVFINATPIADIRPTEKVVAYLAEGDHIVSASPTGICGGALREVRVSVKAGAPVNVRVGYGAGGDMVLDVTAF